MKPKDVITIKKVLDILNEQYPAGVDIPSNVNYEDVQVDEADYFTAKYSVALDKWWIHCTKYGIFRSDDFREFFKIVKGAAALEGIIILDCYVYYGAIKHIKGQKSKGEIFIGNTDSKVKLCK